MAEASFRGFPDTVAFEGTVRENIELGDRRGTGEKVEAAMAAAGIQHLAARQISGLQEKLSGGELQKISIARAMVKEADILILDEPTNHLDQEDLMWLKGMIRDAGRTVLVITHDTRLLEDMDQVVRI